MDKLMQGLLLAIAGGVLGVRLAFDRRRRPGRRMERGRARGSEGGSIDERPSEDVAREAAEEI